MVDPLVLGSDILGTVVAVATPALLWLLLFAWAWEDEPTAHAAGFGRKVFWLLLPAAFLASLANAPFFGWNGSVLAINLGGAAIPLALSVLLPARLLGRAGFASVGRAIAIVAVIAVLLFGLVLIPAGPGAAGFGASSFSFPAAPSWSTPVAPPPALAPFLLAGTVLAGAYAVLDPRTRGRTSGWGDPALGYAVLATVALLATYATTEAVPGVGILSAFPEYLLAPFAVGLLAVLLSRPLLGLPPLAAIAFGYASATVGVLVGADILHQPPLYAGPPGLLSIGGAGILDLVYLSGLLALALAVPAYYLRAGSARSRDAPVPPLPSTVGPTQEFRAALLGRSSAGPRATIAGAARATDLAVDRLRQLRGLSGPPPEGDPWSGLDVHPWLTTDHLNLRALASSPDPGPRDADRALFAAYQLLLAATEVTRRFFGTVRQRALAFLVDLTIVSVPAVVVWAVLAVTLPGSAVEVLSGVPYNTAIFAYSAYGFLYFLVSEVRTGTTPGKRLFGLEVRTRAFGRPGPVPLLVRNAPRLIPLTLVAELLGVAMVLFADHGGPTTVLFGLSGLAATVLALLAVGSVLFVGGITCGLMSLRADRARIGDLWAGTYILRRPAGPPSARS